jgi:PEP-CTERM motif
MLSTYRYTALAATLGLSLAVPKAHAAYVAYIYEDSFSGNVVVQGSGSIDTSFLIFDLSGVSLSPGIDPSNGILYLGAPSTVSVYVPISGPANFGSVGSDATTGSGQSIGIEGGGGFAAVAVPDGYVSGTSLGTSTATWDSTTIAALGATNGTYTWTWSSGAGTDSFTLYIGEAPPGLEPAVPEPSSLSVLAMGLAGLGLVWRARRV